MKEGTIIFTVGVQNWSFIEDYLIIENNYNENKIQIIKYNDRLKVVLWENNYQIYTFITQPLVFTNDSGDMIGMIGWKNKKISFLIINGKDIESSDCSDVLICSFGKIEQEEQVSFLSPDANEKCAVWMNWRKDHFSVLKKTQKDEISKSIEEQVKELEDSIKALDHLYNEVFINHNDYLFSSIYAQLRTLLFWPDRNNKNYEPLLIRIAGFYDLPLPIYSKPKESHDKNTINLVVSGRSFELSYNIAEVDRKQVNWDLIDMQEWLDSCIIYKDIGSNYRLKDFIFDLSNKWGAHNDQGLPGDIYIMKNSIAYNSNSIKSIVENITKNTIKMGEYVLNKCHIS